MKHPTFGDVTRFLTFAMVTGLFLVWLVFGNATVQKQNANILSGVQTKLDKNATELHDLIVANTTGDRAIVCILRIDPDLRTNDNVDRCLTAAEHGKNSITLGGKNGTTKP